MRNERGLINNVRHKSWLFITMIGFMCLIIDNTSLVYASTDTLNLSVSATVNAKCVFSNGVGPSGTAVSFGTYDPLVANATEADNSSGSFHARCTKNTPSQIAMGTGLYASFATGTSRAMSDGMGNYISYEIYTDSGMSTVWNDANTISYTNTGGGEATLPIYASIPAGQDAAIGSYNDTVVMTISY